jgi:hypothetical protein
MSTAVAWSDERLTVIVWRSDLQVKRMGFWGAKVPLPFSPSEGHVGMKKNIDFLQKHRDSVGPE